MDRYIAAAQGAAKRAASLTHRLLAFSRRQPLDPKPLPLNYRHEEETGLYFAGDYNLRGRTPKADVDVCFTP